VLITNQGVTLISLLVDDSYRCSHKLALLSNPGPHPIWGYQEGVHLTASSPAQKKPLVLCRKSLHTGMNAPYTHAFLEYQRWNAGFSHQK